MSWIGAESCFYVTEPKYLLDANSCIYLIEQMSSPLTERMERCAPGSVVTSAIVFAEVGMGTDWTSADASSLVIDFFEIVDIMPFTRSAARRYADLPFARHRLDRLIAAHVLDLDLTLVTANIRDFSDVPGLKVENWTR